MNYKICIVTATRAEYGLLKNLIVKLGKEKEFETRLVVTGMHLSPEFGYTYREIEKDGIPIDKKIEILLSSDTPSSVSKTMGLALIQFAEYFEAHKPDLLLVLGDRYEMLAVCIAAMNQRIPIAHLYGGDTTEGAIDEAIRHSITKMSYLHFTSTEMCRKRVIQLGESPERVFCVGLTGVENIVTQPLLSKKELESGIRFELGESYGVVTFHPVTLEDNREMEQVTELFKALEVLIQKGNMHFILTKANADMGGRVINALLEDFGQRHHNKVIVVDSLGAQRYLSALKYCDMVIGNSSSGLAEAPTFQIPTINIGDRQKGRVRAESVIDCEPTKDSILEAVKIAKSDAMQDILKNVRNPYGDGNTSDKIVEILKETLCSGEIHLEKKFYDIPLSC